MNGAPGPMTLKYVINLKPVPKGRWMVSEWGTRADDPQTCDKPQTCTTGEWMTGSPPPCPAKPMRREPSIPTLRASTLARWYYPSGNFHRTPREIFLEGKPHPPPSRLPARHRFEV